MFRTGMVALVLTTATYVHADADKNADDLKALQGAWEIASLTADGQKLPDEAIKAVRRVITDKTVKVTTKTPEGDVEFEGEMTLDANKAPKTIDVKITTGQNAGIVLVGIYELVSDKEYRVCFSKIDEPRPTDFSCKPGSKHSLTVWKKI